MTILSTKGGVGKTTLTANLGGYLFSQGHRVLMVDADCQPALSSYYNITKQAQAGLAVLYGGGALLEHPIPAVDCVSSTDWGDLVVSDDPMGRLHGEVKDHVNGRMLLKMRLEELAGNYDFVLIDTQGADGAFQEAAVLAGDLVVIPVEPSSVAAKELERSTIALIERCRNGFGREAVPVVKGVLFKVKRTRDARQWAADVRSFAEAKDCGFSLLNVQINNRAGWAESATRRRPVTALTGRKHEGEELRALAAELFPQLNPEVAA